MLWYLLLCYVACFLFIQVVNRYWIKPKGQEERELVAVLSLFVFLFSPVTLWAALVVALLLGVAPRLSSLFGVRNSK